MSERLPRIARKPAEEVGAIARKLLDPLSQRKVQPLAELGDSRLGVLVAFLGDFEGLLERAELAAQCSDLLVEHLDLGQSAQRDALLGVELGRQLGHLVLRRGRAAAEPVVEAPVAVAFAFGCGETGAKLRDLLLER